MGSLPVQGIIQCSEEWIQKKTDPFNESFRKRFSKKTDLKIHDLAVEMISERVQKGSLLVSAQAPNIVFGIMTEFPRLHETAVPKAKPRLKRGKSTTPLGISRPTHFFWINALVQFIIFIPNLRQMFAFVPHSMLPFGQFIDRYLEEQSDHTVTSARSQALVECLYSIFPLELLTQRSSPFDVLLAFMKLLQESSAHLGSDLLAFHPERVLHFQAQDLLENGWVEERLENLFPTLPPEILIYLEAESSKPARQMIISGEAFELDAFIEYRPDRNGNGSYITYLKVEGTWYQCDDLRITPLRSVNLQIALNRSFVFHYKHLSTRNLSQNRYPSILG